MAKEKSPLRQKDIRTGAQQERERIIALIEKHEQIHDWEHSYCSCDSSETDYGTHILALIKGEN